MNTSQTKIKQKASIGPKCCVPTLIEHYNKFFTELEGQNLSSINFDGSLIDGFNLNYCDACSIILYESQMIHDISEIDINLADFEINQASMENHQFQSNVSFNEEQFSNDSLDIDELQNGNSTSVIHRQFLNRINHDFKELHGYQLPAQ